MSPYHWQSCVSRLRDIRKGWLCTISCRISNVIIDDRISPSLFSKIFCKVILVYVVTRGGVEDTRLEAKAKDTKKIRGQGQGQGQPCRGQTLSRPRTGMLEAKAKDQGHKRKCSPKKKKKGLHKNFSGDLKKKKVFTKIFQAISPKKRFLKNFSSAPQNFNNSKNSAVLEPRTGQFSRTSSRPRTSSRTPPLVVTKF